MNKMVVLLGDRSGPAYHDVLIPSIYFMKYELLKVSAIQNINIDDINQADIVFFQRQYAKEALELLRVVKEQGKICIAHIDDNMWEIPVSNPAISAYRGENWLRFCSIMTEAHGCTTSTEYLANKIKLYNPIVEIFRNLVELSIADFKSPGRDVPGEIRIGWTGTPHHHDDIFIAEKALEKVVKKYPNVKLVFMGYKPHTLFDHISEERYEYYEFVPVDAYYHALANLDLDIGIAPLADNGFNKGKTARKAQEYGVLSVVPVLSPLDPYREWVHNDTCFKPERNSPDAWFETLSMLVENKDLREETGKKAYQFVLQNHDIDKYIFERADSINRIVEHGRNK
jgi:glycosyltransferase involved in cell wall biosynthesis